MIDETVIDETMTGEIVSRSNKKWIKLKTGQIDVLNVE